MIVIPMAGLSHRFAQAGYTVPKYMLPLAGRTVFEHAVFSFAQYFDTEAFLFVARELPGTSEFLGSACRNLGIANPSFQMLNAATTGQAETVEIGLRAAAIATAESITVFNIDTFRPGFTYPNRSKWGHSDGYLEVFEGSGANWSYVRPHIPGQALVAETAEKRPISNLCCTGLYHFASAGDFFLALARERLAPSAAELYVAPLYNHLIAAGRRIHYAVVESDNIIFCGVPAEYQALLLDQGRLAGITVNG